MINFNNHFKVTFKTAMKWWDMYLKRNASEQKILSKVGQTMP